LLFFNSPESKAEFLHLLHSNEATDVEDETMVAPTADEIAEAQPISKVLPKDVVDRVIMIATAMYPGPSGIVN